MSSAEEQLTIRFLDYLYKNYGNTKQIKRMALSVGPVIWKLHQLAPLNVNRMGQITFKYGEHRFKGRYSQRGSGQLEILEAIDRRDGRMVCIITNLTQAMTVDMQQTINQFFNIDNLI